LPPVAKSLNPPSKIQVVKLEPKPMINGVIRVEPVGVKRSGLPPPRVYNSSPRKPLGTGLPTNPIPPQKAPVSVGFNQSRSVQSRPGVEQYHQVPPLHRGLASAQVSKFPPPPSSSKPKPATRQIQIFGPPKSFGQQQQQQEKSDVPMKEDSAQ